MPETLSKLVPRICMVAGLRGQRFPQKPSDRLSHASRTEMAIFLERVFAQTLKEPLTRPSILALGMIFHQPGPE